MRLPLRPAESNSLSFRFLPPLPWILAPVSWFSGPLRNLVYVVSMTSDRAGRGKKEGPLECLLVPLGQQLSAWAAFREADAQTLAHLMPEPAWAFGRSMCFCGLAGLHGQSKRALFCTLMRRLGSATCMLCIAACTSASAEGNSSGNRDRASRCSRCNKAQQAADTVLCPATVLNAD